MGQEWAFYPPSPEHHGQNWNKIRIMKIILSWIKLDKMKTPCPLWYLVTHYMQKQISVTYFQKTSLMRLSKGFAGLKLLYQGILETPGQLFSSGDPQSSNIFFNCSGCNDINRINILLKLLDILYAYHYLCELKWLNKNSECFQCPNKILIYKN